MRPLAPPSAAALLVLALAAPGCKGGCDDAGASSGSSPNLSAPDRARFGGSCSGGNCAAPAQPQPQAADSTAAQSLPPGSPGALPAFGDRRVADAGAGAAPEPVKARAVSPPPQAAAGPPPPAHRGVKELETRDELDAALRAGTPMVVKWYGPQCVPCQMLAPAYEAAARVLDGQVAFYSVNSHGEGAPNIPEVKMLPGLAYYENGRLVTHRTGLPSGVRGTEPLKDWLVRALADRSLR